MATTTTKTLEVGKWYYLNNNSFACMQGHQIRITKVGTTYSNVIDTTGYDWLHPNSEIGALVGDHPRVAQ